jgi:hypothetical protein
MKAPKYTLRIDLLDATKLTYQVTLMLHKININLHICRLKK